jgi:pyruvate dehydrogenase E1 component beta subunit
MATRVAAPTDEKLYRVALREALTEEMERDDSVYLIGEDIGKFGGAARS